MYLYGYYVMKLSNSATTYNTCVNEVYTQFYI